MGYNSSICLITLDGIDFKIFEPHHYWYCYMIPCTAKLSVICIICINSYSGNFEKKTCYLKCYHSMPYATRKTHTGLICCVSSYWGDWLLVFYMVTLHVSIIQLAVAFLCGATQQM